MSPTENCSRTRSPQKNIPQKTPGWALPGNLDSSLQFPGVFSLFLTISCHVCPFPGSLLHLIPHTMEHILQHLEPLLSMWILNCSRLEPLLSLTKTPSFYHRTPTIYARNLKYQLSILDMTKYPYCLNWNYYYLGLAERHQTISCVWEA